MKKIVLSTMGAFLMTALMVGCNKSNQTEVLPTTAEAAEEPTSVIDQIEREEGVKFFKRDVMLKSKDGKGEVLMRFASNNKENLEMYLQSHEVSIDAVFKKDLIENKNSEESEKQSSAKPFNYLDAIRILSEPIKIRLDMDAVGYQFTVSEKEQKVVVNGRSAFDYTYYQEEYSSNWPEELRITVHNQQIDVATDRKERWYSSWIPWWLFNTNGPWATLSGGPTQYIKNVDGPWKVVAKIHSVPRYAVCTGGCERNFSIAFINL